MAAPPPPLLTMRDMTYDRVPDLNVNTHPTGSASIHQTHYTGNLGLWNEFENEVRENTRNINRNRTQLFQRTIRAYGSLEGIDPFYNELCVCGNEVGVVGRFTQNVGQPVTNVARGLHMPLVLGDWRIGNGPQNEIPDLAILDLHYRPRIVGEVKTPWTVKFSRAKLRPTMGTIFRRFIGQLAKYMDTMQLKYGFITTYDETMFLKHEVHQGNHYLLFSREILHNTISDYTANPEGNVSLRECMLYFFQLASDERGGWRASKEAVPNDWVLGKEPPLKKYGRGDLTTPKDRRGGPGSSGGAGSSSAGGKITSHGQGPGGNYQQSISDPYADLGVMWDPKAQTFLFRKTDDPSQIRPVEKWKNENGTIIVLAEGRRRRAEVVVPRGPMRRK